VGIGTTFRGRAPSALAAAAVVALLSAAQAAAQQTPPPATSQSPKSSAAPATQPAQPSPGAGPSPAPKAAGAAPAPRAKAAPAQPVKKLDLNNATTEQLKTLPMVGDAEAKAIIEHRPYKSKGELVTKAKLPEGVYHAVRNRVELQTPRKAAPKKK
jgi:DNA uptake protein ComE-like DNA-binding protein